MWRKMRMNSVLLSNTLVPSNFLCILLLLLLLQSSLIYICQRNTSTKRKSWHESSAGQVTSAIQLQLAETWHWVSVTWHSKCCHHTQCRVSASRVTDTECRVTDTTLSVVPQTLSVVSPTLSSDTQCRVTDTVVSLTLSVVSETLSVSDTTLSVGDTTLSLTI